MKQRHSMEGTQLAPRLEYGTIPLEIKSTGKGAVIAAGNGSADDMKSFRSFKPNVFRGKAIAIIQPHTEKGTITLTVSAAGLPDASTTIETY